MADTDKKTLVYHKGTFNKANGAQRTMFFVRVGDLPTTWVDNNTKGTGFKRNLSEGLETVWDIETQAWRTFNWKTVTGEVTSHTSSSEILFLNKFEHKTV